MKKILLLLVISSAVIHQGTTANKSNSDNDEVSFPDATDDSEAIREKMRTEMDNYKRIKEMTIKNKLLSSTTAASTAEVAESTTTKTIEASSVETITEALVDSTSQASSEPSVVSSSTLRPISINLGIPSDFDENGEESTTEYDLENMLLQPVINKTIDDRFIIDAPLICKAGLVEINGKCRKLA